MGLLDRLEQFIERMLEGTTGSLFRQKLQPVEIGKRLEKAMISQQQVSMNAKLVPNEYEVRLNPKDFQQFANFREGLCRQLESALAETARRHQLTTLGRIHVTFVEDAAAAVRNPLIVATLTDQSRRRQARPNEGGRKRPGGAPRSFDQTGVINVPTRVATGLRLVVTSGSYAGQQFDLADGTNTIGRSDDNTIVLKTPDVSRRHACLKHNEHHIRIEDMNSTNGTYVNGEAVYLSDIQPGDRIRIGSEELVLESAQANDQERQQWW